MGRNQKKVNELSADQTMDPKRISFGKLAFEALPEMWGFHLIGVLILGALTRPIVWVMSTVGGAGGGAATSANLKTILLSWRAPVLLLLGVVMILCYIMIELIAQIHLTDDILEGRSSSIRRELGQGIRSLKRFATPAGVSVLIFIFLSVPLTGVGYSISLSQTFHIPNFIEEWILADKLFAVAYAAVLLVMIWAAYEYCFTIHAVLLDGMKPAEAMKASAGIMKKHGRSLLFSLFKLLLVLLAIQAAVYIVFCLLPGILVQRMGQDLPHKQAVDIVKILSEGAETNTEYSIIRYRVLSAFVILVGGLFNASAALLCGAYLMLRFTRYYLAFTRGESPDFPERPKISRYRGKIALMSAAVIGMALLSVVCGLLYDNIFVRDEPVRIVAHRTGGTLASENSIEGLYAAMEHGCYACETDIQRTKDGYYVINHDNDFKRLTGVAKVPNQMTMDEIRELKIRDTTGNGNLLPVVTIEEMLDVIKGKVKLFIELKGATADRQMADDIVRIVREKDCVEDVALISLSYDVISYAETKYPEFETGTLFFAGIGDVSKLNCDLLIMEEEMGTDRRIDQIHDAGKQAIVWTVNTEESMLHFLDSDVDAVITDEIELAERVQKELDERTEYEVIETRLGDFWE